MSRTENSNKRKKTYIIIAIILLLLVAALSLFTDGDNIIEPDPCLTVQTPQKVSLSETDKLTLDVLISSLGDVRYPAASMSISFDPSRLEFLGLEEGNVFVHNIESGSNVRQKLPEWSCNEEQSNKTGLINIMYLDMTGGKNSFSKELLSEDYNVVFRLKFRLRGSLRVGDICDIVVEDAVFAASDEADSLAMTTKTLKVKNGKIIIDK